MSVLIPVGEYRPDLPEFENPGALEALNVQPDEASYRPIKTLTASGGALTARCQGAFSVRSIAGVYSNFAGDATKLYKQNATTLNWADVSRAAGGAYTIASTSMWQFAQFGDIVLATNGTDILQAFTLGSSTLFALNAGSPPAANYIAVAREQVFLGRISGAEGKVVWCGLNDSTAWTASATTQADSQSIASGGRVMGLVGGEYLLIGQERSIKRATYVGSPVIWQFDEISRDHGVLCDYSMTGHEGLTFFLSPDGIYMIVGGQQLQSIGDRKIDRTLLADLDSSYLTRVTAAVDPVAKLLWISYPGAGNSGGTPNKCLLYNWATGRWARAEIGMEMIYAAATITAATSLDDADEFADDIDAVGAPSLDSSLYTGSGRFLLSAFTAAHKQAFFTGTNMAATVDTTETQLTPSQRTVVRSVRPAIDGGSPAMQVGGRNRLIDTTTWSSARTINSLGRCRIRKRARYHRARINTVAGDSWSNLQGIAEIEAHPSGWR